MACNPEAGIQSLNIFILINILNFLIYNPELNCSGKVPEQAEWL